jgi:hypothetical protein
MLKDLLRKLNLIGPAKQPVDPAKFNDPLALSIEWTPASRGGTNFRTHKLVEIDFSRVEFKPAASAKVFYSFIALMGVVVATMFFLQPIESGELPLGAFIPLFFGGAVIIGAGFMFYFGSAPIVFDKGVGYFWKGRRTPQESPEPGTIKKVALLEDIHAIQLVAEYVRTGKSSYYSYEINLVLNDGRRLTVIDHGNLKRIREDAGKLSEFLGKPVWDAI